MKKIFILLYITSLFSNTTLSKSPLNEFVPYFQNNTTVNKDAFGLIWKEAMKAKNLYNQLQSRNEFINNLASTAPRSEFIVNVDISPELALANPEGQVFLSTDGQNTWQSALATPMTDEGYENTWQSTINNNGAQDVSWYVSAAVDSEPLGFDYGRIIVSQTPYNDSGAFPPPNGYYALLAEDETGETNSGQDITNLRGTYNESNAYVSMGINGGCCDEGGFFGPWYLYGVAIVNPEAENAVAYAIGYADGAFGQLTSGVYKITGDLQTGEVDNFELIGNVDVNTNGNNMQATTPLNTIFNDSDWGTWPNSFQGYIMLGVTVQAGLDGLDIAIELKDQTAPGLALLTTQTQSGNIDCELSNLMFDSPTNSFKVNYIDQEGNLPWFKQFQICAQNDGPCFYFGDMLATEHNYLEGTTFSHMLPDQINDASGEMLANGDYLAKVWFADGEVGEYQLSENIMIINGQIVGDEEPCPFLGDVNNDGNLNVQDIVLTVNNVLCLDGGECYDVCGDMNQDSILNVLDIVILIDIILNN